MNGLSYKNNLLLHLFLVYFIWGSTYLGVKIAIADLEPMWLTAMRFFIGGIILFGFSIFKNGLPKASEVYGSVVLGVFLIGIGTTFVGYAIKFIPSGMVALLVSLLPAWVLILDFLFFSKKLPSILSMSGLGIGLCGILVLFLPSDIGKVNDLKLFPVLIVFLSSISWAFGSLLSPTLKQAHGVQGTAIQMLTGGITATILSFIFEENQWSDTLEMSQKSILAMAYLIFIGSFIGYSAFIWLINNAPPLLTSSYAFVNPVVALILGYYLANEDFNEIVILASLIILAGVVLMTLGRRKMKAEKEID